MRTIFLVKEVLFLFDVASICSTFVSSDRSFSRLEWVLEILNRLLDKKFLMNS